MRHGSKLDPPNRFDNAHTAPDLEQLEWDVEYLQERNDRPIQYLADTSKSIVVANDSPDIPFRYSVNPYRGCVHGCSYCKPYPFSASCGSASVYPCRDDRNYFQRLGFRLNRGVRR